VNQVKLKEAQERFFNRYPDGFLAPQMIAITKKHKVEKMKKMAQESFAVERFENADDIVVSMCRIVSQSSLISVFEKPKFKDAIRYMSKHEIEDLAQGLKNFLYGDQEAGFELMAGLLGKYRLAKWPLLTIYGIYFRPQTEVFVKPTTAKKIIEYFELTGLKYNSMPTFAFYQAYREQIKQLKQAADDSLQVDNAAFCGFLMLSIESGE
jgi:hypothetical protein